MAKAITINELYKALAKYKKEGKGEKKILLTNDDECNGFHECFFMITPFIKEFNYAHLPYGVTLEQAINDYVILG